MMLSYVLLDEGWDECLPVLLCWKCFVKTEVFLTIHRWATSRLWLDLFHSFLDGTTWLEMMRPRQTSQPSKASTGIRGALWHLIWPKPALGSHFLKLQKGEISEKCYFGLTNFRSLNFKAYEKWNTKSQEIVHNSVHLWWAIATCSVPWKAMWSLSKTVMP